MTGMMAIPLAVASAMAWQHMRYLRARRDIVQDRQPVFSSGFHVITFLELADGADVVAEVGQLGKTLEEAHGARLVYAGQGFPALESSQLGPVSWSAVVLMQYPSRRAYDQAAQAEAHRDALGHFDRTYSHGMRRPWPLNLLVPQALLMLAVVDKLRGSWELPPLEAAPPSELAESMRDGPERMLELRAINDEAVVVFNLIKQGSAAQRAADGSYGRKMIARMARLAHGPIHVGVSVTLEGDAAFDQVVVVYYPGVSYFAQLVRSRFFQGIVGDKRPGDSQAVLTVPILSRLDERAAR